MVRLVVDRYEIFEEIASGGMATVFLGRLRGGSGFSRMVAIKRLHAHLARDPLFLGMFLDEARLAARIRHPNVVSTLDVVSHDGESFVVMDYVHGESLARARSHLAGQGKKIPLPVIGAIVSGILQGLHAAHEARDEEGHPLCIVHRDVSPQNVLVGVDGVTRVVDFGVAKAAGRIQTTADGQVKGKASYMAPEQIAGKVDRRTDVFAASIILWELVTSQRLFTGESQAETLAKVLAAKVPSPRSIEPSLSPGLEEVILAGLDPVPERRFSNAREMDQALLRAMPVASTFDVAEWFGAALGPLLETRALAISQIEAHAGRRALPVNVEEAGTLTESIPVTVTPPTSGSNRSRQLLLAGMAVALAGGLLVASRSWRSADPAIRIPPASPAPQTTSASAASSPPPSASAAEPPTSAETPPATPSASTPPRAHVALPQASAHPKARSPNCNPPYWLDAKGKHFKDECL